jgi:hypothetical protein
VAAYELTSAGGAVEPIALALLAGGAAEPMAMTKAAMEVELMGSKNSEVAEAQVPKDSEVAEVKAPKNSEAVEVKVPKKGMPCQTVCET